MRSREILETVKVTGERLNDIRDSLGRLVEYVAKLDSMLIVREPSTERAAQAYEGLRRQVAAGAKARRAHLAQLVRMRQEVERLHRRARDEDITAVDVVRNVEDLVGQWVQDAGLEAVDRPDQPHLYEIETEEADEELPYEEVVAPAYIDSSDPQNPVLIERGRLVRRIPPAADRIAQGKEDLRRGDQVAASAEDSQGRPPSTEGEFAGQASAEQAQPKAQDQVEDNS